MGSEVPFIHTHPLPLIRVKVNDQEANFIIDTGASEIYLDTEFAKKAGAQDFGSTVETYGGGKKAATGHGKIDKLTLGDLTIKNLPTLILSTQQFSAAAGGLKVDGILGTVLFYHFLSTIDYPNEKLQLLPKTTDSLKQIERSKTIVLPFWMSGDHFMVTWGEVNKGKSVHLLVDTGLAGGGFVPTESTLKESGIKLPEGQSFEGIGGGGKVKVVPIVVENLSLGEAQETNVNGFFGPFPPQLEFSEGFRIGGIISHEFFRSYALTFDFDGMRLLLLKRKLSQQ
jgi:clan AA aspartic protease (TIGR02281 family)